MFVSVCACACAQLILSLVCLFVCSPLSPAHHITHQQNQMHAVPLGTGMMHTHTHTMLNYSALCLDSNASPEGFGCGEQPVENNSC